MADQALHAASFRDPAGFIFTHKSIIYRQVNKAYAANYDLLMESGLYQTLIEKQLLIPHQEVNKDLAPESSLVYKVIQPEPIPFISYPYEWSFSQLKDAALLTLSLEELALEKGMTLKDASAFNVQFNEGRPIFIDTLSFDVYKEGEPWVAYRQFCQHFLAPLALMAHSDIRLNALLKTYIDGIPLDLAAKLLPGKTKLNVGLFTHLHLHARAQTRYASSKTVRERPNFSRTARLGLLANLRSTVGKLSLPRTSTEWGDYYDNTNYSDKAFTHKKEILTEFIETIKPKKVCDIGANNGLFSEVAGQRQIWTLSADIDPLAVEYGYQEVCRHQQTHILPLLIDITNPTPGIGWGNTERQSFLERLDIDALLALALIHHLAIGNNLPLVRIAEQFALTTPRLVIEFVPKEDSQVQKLLANRHDHFADYTKEGFEKAFGHYFTLEKQVLVKDSKRTMYLMARK